MFEAHDSEANFAFGPWEQGLGGAWAPELIDTIEPGPALAAALETIDVATLSGFDRVRVLHAHRRMATHYEAQAYRDMAAIDEALEHHNRDPETSEGAAAEAEVRAALAWTKRHAEVELSFALELAHRLPHVHRALLTGHIDVRKAKAMASSVGHLADSTAAQLTSAVLDEAPRLTTGELTSRLRKLSLEHDPDDAATRLDDAHSERRVEVRPNIEGTASVSGRDLSPIDAQAISRRIHHLARAAKSADDPRSPDQVRADVFVDLLLGRASCTAHSEADPAVASAASTSDTTSSRPSPAGSVEIRVDLTTLAQLNDAPGDLAGYDPVVADIARQVAAEQAGSKQGVRTTWSFAVTDPKTRAVVSTGIVRRRPTAGMARTVRALRTECAFPGCRVPASDCDLDHTRAWSTSRDTSVENLAPLCRADHRIKGELGWQYRITRDGEIRWTSPLGHRYVKQRPPP